MMRAAVVVVVACAGVIAEEAPIPLWRDASLRVSAQIPETPSITPFLPERPNGAAVVIAPGGGYGALALDHEGKQIAEWLNKNGITAFVLRYRHGPDNPHPAPLSDAQRAIHLVRSRASEWHVDPNRVGIIGFSAGGHLTASAATQFDPEGATPSFESPNTRPDFAILIYPVITMSDPHTHRGSRRNLLGENPSNEAVIAMSAERNVTSKTPPCFLVHTTDDTVVPVQNSLMFYRALVENGVPAELHIYEQGRHGLGMAPNDPSMSTWPALCIEWLRKRGVIE